MTEISLDLKDRRILYELDLDSRQSFSRMGKKVRLSKEVVNYRVKRLMELGVVRQFHTVINVGKLGYTSFRLFLKLGGATPAKEKEIVEYLLGQKIVVWLVSVEGNWDLVTWCCVRDVGELSEFWRGLFARYGQFIEDNWLSVWSRVWYFRRAYLLDKKFDNTRVDVFISEPEKPDVDESDLKILRVLAGDARAPVIKIAHDVGLSEKTVESRIKNMIKKGVIASFRTLFDLELLGVQYYKIHFKLQNMTPAKLREMRAYAHAHPNIVYDNEVLGGADFEIDVQTRGEREFRELLEGMRNKFAEHIRGHEVLRYYKEHKLEFMPARESYENK